MNPMFEIYTHEVELKVGDNTYKYKLRPLSGRYLPKFYKIISKTQELNLEDDKEMFKLLDEETISILHELSLKTLQKSYSDVDEETLDEFVSQNLLQMMEGLIKVNMGVEQDK